MHITFDLSSSAKILNPLKYSLSLKIWPSLFNSSYTAHLEHVTTKIMNWINLLRKVKSLKLNNQEEICMTIFNSQIRSLLDYAFIPIISPTQKIAPKLQTLQNRALKTIKHFPFKTSTKHIHEYFNIDLLEARSIKLAKKFASSRLAHPQLCADYVRFTATRTPPELSRFKTIFDKIPEFL